MRFVRRGGGWAADELDKALVPVVVASALLVDEAGANEYNGVAVLEVVALVFEVAADESDKAAVVGVFSPVCRVVGRGRAGNSGETL